MKIYHDGDGKIYTYDKNGHVQWLFEVKYSDGNIVEIINNLIEDSSKCQDDCHNQPHNNLEFPCSKCIRNKLHGDLYEKEK